MVVERDCDLNESLEKLALRLGRGAPDILQNFVRLKKFGGIEQVNTAM